MQSGAAVHCQPVRGLCVCRAQQRRGRCQNQRRLVHVQLPGGGRQLGKLLLIVLPAQRLVAGLASGCGHQHQPGRLAHVLCQHVPRRHVAVLVHQAQRERLVTCRATSALITDRGARPARLLPAVAHAQVEGAQGGIHPPASCSPTLSSSPATGCSCQDMGAPGTLLIRRRSLKLHLPRRSSSSSTEGDSHCLGAARPAKEKMWVSGSSSSQACRGWRAGRAVHQGRHIQAASRISGSTPSSLPPRTHLVRLHDQRVLHRAGPPPVAADLHDDVVHGRAGSVGQRQLVVGGLVRVDAGKLLHARCGGIAQAPKGSRHDKSTIAAAGGEQLKAHEHSSPPGTLIWPAST